jgi:hypothetical protein
MNVLRNRSGIRWVENVRNGITNGQRDHYQQNLRLSVTGISRSQARGTHAIPRAKRSTD